MRKLCLSLAIALVIPAAFAQTNNSKDPTWWEKYQYLVKNGEMAGGAATSSVSAGPNVDVSNECRPQSETYITVNTPNAKQHSARSNEIFRDPMRGYRPAGGGKSWGGRARVAGSSDHGVPFDVTRADDPQGPGRSIGAVPFVGPNGEVYLAWNDYAANTIAFTRSFDGGATWEPQRVIASKQIPFDIRIPAEFNRGALVYPSCDADRSKGADRGRLVCSWMDLAGQRHDRHPHLVFRRQRRDLVALEIGHRCIAIRRRPVQPLALARSDEWRRQRL